MANKKREEWLGADPIKMNDEDFSKMQANSDAWFAAKERGDTAAMAAAHDENEAIRAKYGYSGGEAGIEYNKLPEGESYQYGSVDKRPASYTPQYAQDLAALTQQAAPTYTPQYSGQLEALIGQRAPEFTSQYTGAIRGLSGRQAPVYQAKYDGDIAALRERTAPVYNSPYGAEIEEATRALLSRDPFSYNPDVDPMYQAYRKEYRREGQRTAADTLGDYAAMTGGMPSTAAVTASRQAGNYYNAKLADVIPELYKLAYSMYQDEGNQKVRDINALRALESDEYGRYVNDLNQYNADRNFDYSVLSQLSNEDYNRYLTDLNQFNSDRAFDYNLLNQLEQNDRNDYITRLNQWNADRSFDANLLNQLEQNAYNRYLTDLNRYNTDRSFNAGVLSQLEGDAYNRYLNDLSRWNSDRAFEYGQQRDAVQDALLADETAYNRAWNEDERAYNRGWNEDERAYQRERDALDEALTMAQLGAEYGDYSGLGGLGITPDMAARMQMELAQSGRVTPIGAGGSGGNGETGGKDTPPAENAPSNYERVKKVIAEMKNNGATRAEMRDAINAARAGLTQDDYKSIYKMFLQ